MREGEAASRVRHPHIVEVFDVGEHEGNAYLVMELLEGADLSRHLAQRGALAPEALSDLMVPVCAAVSAAHGAGVIHRDLKPENICLARAQHGGALTPKVLDFGVSRIEDDDAQRTATAALLGTPSFMAPEQARGAKFADARSDQYSLGVVLYLGATGRLPIDEPAVYELLRRVVHGEFEAPTRVRPELAPAFDAYWAKTGTYWKDVRDTWSAILKEKDGFSMKDTYDGKQLFMIHFDHAAKLEKDGEMAPDANRKHAQDTIRNFLAP
jgi:serine/threonine-protein kinase